MRQFYALILAFLALLLGACGTNSGAVQLLPETNQPIFTFFYTDN